MNRLFTINGRQYKAAAVDFNFVCDLEDMGISLSEFKSKPMAIARAYFALCANASKDVAGVELQSHMVNGGKLEELYEVLGKQIEESDFFRALNTTEEQEVTANAPKEKKTKNKAEQRSTVGYELFTKMMFFLKQELSAYRGKNFGK